VGVRLTRPETRSSLEGLNFAFAFYTTGGEARLIAVLYDQFGC
jgi:hypothetical protein